MDHSPKLREAMHEIRAVLKKHNIAAYVLLHEPGFSEFLRHVTPSWSLLRLESHEGRHGLRFRSKLVDFGGDKEAQKTATNNTVNLLVHLRDRLSEDAVVFYRLLDMLQEHFDIEEGESTEVETREH